METWKCFHTTDVSILIRLFHCHPFELNCFLFHHCHHQTLVQCSLLFPLQSKAGLNSYLRNLSRCKRWDTLQSWASLQSFYSTLYQSANFSETFSTYSWSWSGRRNMVEIWELVETEEAAAAAPSPSPSPSPSPASTAASKLAWSIEPCGWSMMWRIKTKRG